MSLRNWKACISRHLPSGLGCVVALQCLSLSTLSLADGRELSGKPFSGLEFVEVSDDNDEPYARRKFDWPKSIELGTERSDGAKVDVFAATAGLDIAPEFGTISDFIDPRLVSRNRFPSSLSMKYGVQTEYFFPVKNTILNELPKDNQKTLARMVSKTRSGKRVDDIKGVDDRSRNVLPAQLESSGLVDEIANTNWSINTRLQQRLRIDDNIFLDTEDEVTAYGSITSPAVQLRARGERLDIDLDATIEISRFNEGILDTEDIYLKGTTSYNTLLARWDLVTDFTYDTARSSEITDTGIFDAQARRVRWEVAPSWTYDLSPRDVMVINGGYIEQRFEGGTSTLTDFRFFEFGGGYARQLTERAQLKFDLDSGVFETQNGPDSVESEKLTAQLGLDFLISERMRVTGSTGLSYISTDEINTEDTIKFAGNGSWYYKFDENTNLKIQAVQSIEPSSSGTFVERRTFNFAARYKPLQVLSFGFSAFYLTQESAIGDIARDREYYSLEPSIRWRTARDWVVKARYRYRSQKGSNDDGWAHSNGLFVGLTYQTER